MYQNCCKKCGSIDLHIEVKGNNTGLYCNDCGAWVKWLGKDELRAFEYANKHRERCSDNRFDIIEKAKEDILKKTNIETNNEEMKVLNSFLFRCWQMGWLDKYKN